jgi:anti-anti-sigma factor
MGWKPHTCVAVRDDEALMQTCGALVLNSESSNWLLEPGVGPRRITWDLSRVSDIDARGLGVLADAARRARDRGVHLSVLAASAVVHRLAALAKLDTVIPGDWNARGGAVPGVERCD